MHDEWLYYFVSIIICQLNYVVDTSPESTRRCHQPANVGFYAAWCSRICVWKLSLLLL